MEFNLFEVFLEMRPFLEIQEEMRILEIADISQQMAPIIKNVSPWKGCKMDLCFTGKGRMNQEAMGYYENIFIFDKDAMSTISYDVILISTTLNELSKEEGKRLLKNLSALKASIIYALVKDDAGKQTWTIPDFRTFDISFYRLPKINQKLIKIYPSISTPIKPLPPLSEVRGPLSILYVMPHKNLTGGLKMLYEQMKILQKKGHKITVMIRGNYERVVPDWVENFTPDAEIIRLPEQPYLDETIKVDVIYAGYFYQIEELDNQSIPVLYWEQGHGSLYGDVMNLSQEKFERMMLKRQFGHDIYYATDSSYVHDVVQTRFGRNSYVLPIFIDTSFYYPNLEKKNDLLTILLVGNPVLEFKGFVKALTVLIETWNQGHRFRVVWACQVKPKVSPLPFEIEYQVNVSQIELARIYRESDILLSCSIYEGCPMPPLEAMASGVAVVATDCGGIMQYAKHGKNALISKHHTVNELTELLKVMLSDERLRKRLIQQGLRTAESLNFENGVIRLENIFQTIVEDFNQKNFKLVTGVKKIKILFLIGTLLGGGAEKVLVNLVKALDKTLFDITVQTVYDKGIYIDEVKKYATYKTIYKMTAKNNEEVQFLNNYYNYLYRLTIGEFSQMVIDDGYDIEVAFLEDESTRIISYSPNKHAKKIAWVHTDLITHTGADKLFIDFNEHKSCYEKFNQIICVSEVAKEAFIKKFNINHNVCVAYNPINEEEIKRKAHSSSDLVQSNDNHFRIVSVGRLVKEKGYDRLLIALKNLKDREVSCHLTIIGEGVQRASLEKYIHENELEDSVSLMGFLENPYPIVANAHLFVCSSYVEGFSVAVAESLILGVPIVATKCGGVQEVLKNGERGLLVENTTQALYDGIYQVLIHPSLYARLREGSQKGGSELSFTQAVSKIQKFLLE